MATGPKWSRGALDVVNNTYVVRNGLLFEYYPISCYPYKEEDKFIKLEISPGIISPGIAIVGKQLYDVSLEDLFRRRINVAKRHKPATGANIGRRSIGAKKGKSITKLEASPNQQTASPSIGSEISKAVDVAWEDQVESLLQTILAKEGEEFEITGTTQSGRIHETRSVSDLFEDIDVD